MVIISPDNLRKLCSDILLNSGAPPEHAYIISDSLVRANLRGIDSHGVFRLTEYISRIRNGTLDPSARPRILREFGSTAVLDGSFGFGQIVGVQAMRLAIQKAQESGIGAVSARNSNHFGMASYYSMMALDREMIGIVTCNSGPYVAPYGGYRRVLGTNPIAIAIPSDADFPFVIDMATSTSSLAKIMHALKLGKEIPKDWALDSSGRPTSDPQQALEGSLLPFGGAKGYALNLFIDILSGALAGTGCGPDVISLTGPSKKATVGQFFEAISVSAFLPVSDFKRIVTKLIMDVKKSEPSPGFGQILVPGELEHMAEKERNSNGIDLDSEAVTALSNMARELNVDLKRYLNIDSLH